MSEVAASFTAIDYRLYNGEMRRNLTIDEVDQKEH